MIFEITRNLQNEFKIMLFILFWCLFLHIAQKFDEIKKKKFALESASHFKYEIFFKVIMTKIVLFEFYPDDRGVTFYIFSKKRSNTVSIFLNIFSKF